MNNKWNCSLSASAVAARRWALCGLAGLALGVGVLGAAMQAGGGAASAQGVASPVVTTTRDGGAGSLRAAMLLANQKPGSTITFAIPRGDAGFRRGVWTILLRRSLPPVSAARTTIDGTSQTRFGGNTNLTGPEIEIFGGDIQLQVLVPTPAPTSAPTPTTSGPLVSRGAIRAMLSGGSLDQQAAPTPTPTATPAPSFEEARPNGLTIVAPFATVRGLAIGGFGGNGIEFRSTFGGQTSQRLSGGNFGRVEGCTIGLEAHGTRAEPNLGAGVNAELALGTTIGSPQAERNLIAGNGRSLLAAPSGFGQANTGTVVTVQNNWFGLDATGEVLVPVAVEPGGSPARSDVVVRSAMRFGGTRASERNVVARPALIGGVGTVQNNVFGFSASGRRILLNTDALSLESGGFASGSLLVGGPTAQSRNYTVSCTASVSTPRGVVLQNNWLGWSQANVSSRNGVLAEANAQIGAALGDPAPLARGNRLAGPIYLYSLSPGSASARATSTIRGNVLAGEQGFGGPIAYDNGFGLFVTPNDLRDGDVGTNGLQNAPTLGEARLGKSGLKLSLGLHSRPSTSYIVDFYAHNPSAQTWTPFASRAMRTGSTGDAFLSTLLASSPTRLIAATATDTATGATSPLSNLITATPGEELPEPTIVTHVARNFGPIGAEFTLYGRGLSRISQILFIGPRASEGPDTFVRAPFTRLDGQTIRAVIPVGAQTGRLSLVLQSGQRVRVEGIFGIISAEDNDFFSQARRLSGESGAVTDVFGRTGEGGEPAHAGVPAQRSKWFRWTAPRDGLAEWLLLQPGQDSSNSNWRLAAYTGTSLESLRPLASFVNSAFSFTSGKVDIQFQVRAGTTYFIAADAGFIQRFTLAWRYATEIERSRAPKPSTPPPSIQLSSARASELQVLARSRATSRDPRSS